MAWVPKVNVQVHSEKDAKVELKAKNEKGVGRRAPNQWFASNHQVLSLPHYLYSSPISPTMPGIRSQVCMIIPHGLILILGCHMDLFIMEGYYQIIMCIDSLQ